MSWGADVAEAFGDALDAELADALLDSVDDVVDDALASQLDEISGGGGCVVVDVDARDPVFVHCGGRARNPEAAFADALALAAKGGPRRRRARAALGDVAEAAKTDEAVRAAARALRRTVDGPLRDALQSMAPLLALAPGGARGPPR
ncbi:hypothetical protein SO694_00046285 [Aureococcus anophagefferens]|uniref:Uncharacterized protein n=1 Tax=Aureococcus anophagefferens TaxID=44056 RepID=A0ABR1G7T9_AURAN